jgi:hypothetical protein
MSGDQVRIPGKGWPIRHAGDDKQRGDAVVRIIIKELRRRKSFEKERYTMSLFCVSVIVATKHTRWICPRTKTHTTGFGTSYPITFAGRYAMSINRPPFRLCGNSSLVPYPYFGLLSHKKHICTASGSRKVHSNTQDAGSLQLHRVKDRYRYSRNSVGIGS